MINSEAETVDEDYIAARFNGLLNVSSFDSEGILMENLLKDNSKEKADSIYAKARVDYFDTYITIDMENKVDSTISDDFRDGAKKATIFFLIITFSIHSI